MKWGIVMQKWKIISKDKFAVVGKMGQGKEDNAEQWINSLWEAAGEHFHEIESLLPKNDDGKPIALGQRELWTNVRWPAKGRKIGMLRASLYEAIVPSCGCYGQ